MKYFSYLLMCILVFASSTCKKEKCHNHISVINNSPSEIIVSIPLINQFNKCKLDGKIVKAGGIYNYLPFNSCIENNLKDTQSIKIYVVDPKLLNDTNSYYNCDSISVKNLILKYYALTLYNLNENHYTITYPY